MTTPNDIKRHLLDAVSIVETVTLAPGHKPGEVTATLMGRVEIDGYPVADVEEARAAIEDGIRREFGIDISSLGKE